MSLIMHSDVTIPRIYVSYHKNNKKSTSMTWHLLCNTHLSLSLALLAQA